MSRGRLILLAATLVCGLVYLAGPHAGFVFDDSVTILHNRMVQESPGSAIRENPFRSVVNLTFWLQHRLHRPDFAPRPLQGIEGSIRAGGGGRLRPVWVDPATGATVPVTLDTARGLVFPFPPAWPFHLFNLAVHLLNGWLLFYILRRIGAAFSDQGDTLAALCAAAFVLHPLATEPVNYITARFALLALTFSLAATLAHLRADGRGRGELIAAVFYVLALFCKETAAPLPAVLFALDVARGRFRPLSLAGLGLLAVYAAARSQWLVVLSAKPGEVLDWPLYFLVEQWVFWLYALKIAAPVRLNFDYHLLSRPGLDAVFAALNLGLLGLAGWRVTRALTGLRGEGGEKKPEKKSRLEGRPNPDRERESRPAGRSYDAAAVVFLVSWLLLAPTSSVIPLADLAREDRAYPLLAVLIPAVGFGLWRLITPAPGLARPAAIAAATVLLLLAAGSVARNQAWRDELSLHRDIVSQSPAKARAAYNYATALKWHGRLSEAVRWYERTLALDPTHQNARRNLETLRRLPPDSVAPAP